MTYNKKIEKGYDKVIELLMEIKQMVDDLCVYLLYDRNIKTRKNDIKK